MDKIYFCVLDFEATCWDRNDIVNKNKPYEIIEFPSVLLKVSDNENKLEVVSEFQKYCRPQENQKLSNFCTTLTGIQQKQVDCANTFPTILEEHHNWLVKETDGNTNKIIFVTCGSWDFEVAFNKELGRWIQNYKFYCSEPQLYNTVLNVPSVYKSFINLKDIFKSLYDLKPGGMVSMLDYLKITLTGRHHSGLDDCKNISKILQKMYVDAIDSMAIHAKDSMDFVNAKDKINKHFSIRKVIYKHKDPRQMWTHNPKFKK